MKKIKKLYIDSATAIVPTLLQIYKSNVFSYLINYDFSVAFASLSTYFQSLFPLSIFNLHIHAHCTPTSTSTSTSRIQHQNPTIYFFFFSCLLRPYFILHRIINKMHLYRVTQKNVEFNFSYTVQLSSQLSFNSFIQ